MREFERAATSLRDGDINFDEFGRVTRFYWLSHARKLMGRYSLPSGIDAEDVVQVLLFAAWEFSGKFDQSRGKSFKEYIVWNAYDKANKWLNKQRNSHNRSNTTPSRFPVCLVPAVSSDGSEDGRGIEEMLVCDPVAKLENEFDVYERLHIAIKRTYKDDPSSAVVLTALRCNELDVGATIENLTAARICKTQSQAFESLRLAAETYL